MIIRSFTRRPNAFQALLSTATTRPVAAVRQSPIASIPLARHAHNVPKLDNHAQLQAEGIPGLFSPKAFDIAFSQYQKHLLDELSILTAGTVHDNQDVKSLVIEFARDPMKAYHFNLASMAFNNVFFFNGINTAPNVTSAPTTDLKEEIGKSFSSMDTLKDEFLTTAEVMFGPGFVWLVQTNDTASRRMKILTTYLAGSPLSAAHFRKQGHDLNTHNAESYEALNTVGAFGSSSRKAHAPLKPQKPLGGVDVIPLLCVNTWQHAWLPDYGITGKADYLEAWWDKIDWNKVLQLALLTKAGDRPIRFFAS